MAAVLPPQMYTLRSLSTSLFCLGTGLEGGERPVPTSFLNLNIEILLLQIYFIFIYVKTFNIHWPPWRTKSHRLSLNVLSDDQDHSPKFLRFISVLMWRQTFFCKPASAGSKQFLVSTLHNFTMWLVIRHQRPCNRLWIEKGTVFDYWLPSRFNLLFTQQHIEQCSFKDHFKVVINLWI